MTDNPATSNALLPVGGLRSTRPGDVPERLKARYFVEDHGREWRFFVDARVPAPVFEDRGRQLVSRRSDPNAVRDMIAIADHRGWRMVDARGDAAFRREAWLAGRAAGLEVRGYRPTERDLQDLERRTAARQRIAPREAKPGGPAQTRRDGASERLQVAETVIRSRIVEPREQARLLSNARQRIAEWLERGARFTPVAGRHEATRAHETKERRRAR
jgi:hypothetical protein